jgi:hypothetical protein
MTHPESRNKREGKWNPSMHFRGIYQRNQNHAIWFDIKRSDRKAEQRSGRAWRNL